MAARSVLVCGAAALLVVAGCTSHAAAAPTVTVTVTAHPSPSPAASASIGAGPLLQPESCVRISVGADGNPGPVTCPDGHPNAYAMPALQGTAPHMISLGEFATTDDISAAACADLAKGSTFPIEESAYKFMKALNGWSFGIDPTNGGIFTFCR
jgi:hypothetical protein